MDVSAAQAILNGQGATLAVDGALGPKTMTALLAVTRGASAGYTDPGLVAIADALVATLGDINTVQRLRYFLAQAACETFAFRRLKESDGGDPNYYFRMYDPQGNPSVAKALGNTENGDGALFCGRGLLDTTGRWNYTYLARVSGLDCVNHPEILEQPGPACTAALAFWDVRNCNQFADAGDMLGLTKAINGGTNGLSDREAYFARLHALAA